MKSSVKRILLLFILLFLWSAPALMQTASAAPAVITSCKLISSKKVRVTATLSNPSAVQGNKCYLFALSFSDSGITQKMKPVQSKTKASKMTFSVKLNSASTTSRLYSRFALAQKNADGTYTIISDTKYLSNPKKAAKYKYKFPTAVSKKGLQVSESMLEDAVELNVRHSVLNLVFSDMIAAKNQRNKKVSISYSYHGKTYWFRRSVIESYDRQLTALQETNAIVSGVLLLGWRSDLKNLIYPSGRQQGHSFYAWNTSGAAAREQLQAALAFLANRYGSSSASHGRIVNWIVGNEVNNYNVYNYAGQKTLQQYALIYANAFRMTYNTITSVYANARVYISLDHLWNTDTVSGTFAARKMLDAFASALASQGSIPWNLAYHPYGSPLTEPKFWANTNGQLTGSLTSPVINMGNISLLTSYIRQNYGASTRIILSEQGYTSVQNGTNVEKEQSAAIAYSYYLTESDDMIDSFIMNRQVDHQAEVDQGLNLGLWTTVSGSNPEWAGTQKDSWSVFKYMDSNQSETYTSGALSIIGASAWSNLISNYSPALYNKTNITPAALTQVSGYAKTASIPSKWKPYGAAQKMAASKTTLKVTHDNRRNSNALWGFSQTFKKLSFKSHSSFYTTLKVTGSNASQVLVKIRFYSGSDILECSRVIKAGAAVKLGVSLKNWSGRGKVTKIQVLAAPQGGGWGTKAAISMKLPVRGK